MNFLSKIPVWGWYLFSLLFCYLVWNPLYSLWHLMQGGADPSVKVLFAVAALIVLSLYIVEGSRSFNLLGLCLFFGFIGAAMWVAFAYGFNGFGSIHLWGQLILALFMTLAVQGGRIMRNLTARVPVNPPDDSGGHHDHHTGVSHHG